MKQHRWPNGAYAALVRRLRSLHRSAMRSRSFTIRAVHGDLSVPACPSLLHSVATPRRPPWLLSWAGCLHTFGQLSLAFVNLLPLGVRASPSLFYLRRATLPYLLSTSPASPRYAEVRRLHGYPSQDPSDTTTTTAARHPSVYAPGHVHSSSVLRDVARLLYGGLGRLPTLVCHSRPPAKDHFVALYAPRPTALSFPEAAILGVAET